MCSARRRRVTYRFPPAEAQTEMWNVSTDRISTFVEDPIPFLRSVATSDRLVAQTVPYNESPTTAIFELGGAQDAVVAVAGGCGWALNRNDLSIYADTEFPLANLSRLFLPVTEVLVNGVGVTAAFSGLPDGIGAAFFLPEWTMATVKDEIEAGGDAMIYCPRAEERAGNAEPYIALVECRIQR